MSIETLLLLAVFVLLPLLQQLLRAAQARNEQEPAPSARPPAVPTPVRPPARPAAPGRPPAAAPGPMLARRPASARAADVRTSARRRDAGVNLRSPREFRRAVVHMTILGSCRAKSPYRWPEEE